MRLANVRITVGKTKSNFDDPPEDEICSYLPGQPPADVFRMNCGYRMCGRYVRINALSSTRTRLNLYELEIIGYKP